MKQLLIDTVETACFLGLAFGLIWGFDTAIEFLKNVKVVVITVDGGRR